MTIQNVNQNSLTGRTGTFVKPELIINEEGPKPSVEEIEKHSMDALKAAAELGKTLVRKTQLNTEPQDFSKTQANVGIKVNKKVNICDEKVKSNDNAFRSIEDFKNAGGSFDKYGTALINGKPFDGVIRLKYDEKYPEDDFSSRYNSRQYAIFDDSGHLNQVLTVDNKCGKVTLDTMRLNWPGSSVANYEIITEQFDVTDCPFEHQNVLLEKYGIG